MSSVSSKPCESFISQDSPQERIECAEAGEKKWIRKSEKRYRWKWTQKTNKESASRRQNFCMNACKKSSKKLKNAKLQVNNSVLWNVDSTVPIFSEWWMTKLVCASKGRLVRMISQLVLDKVFSFRGMLFGTVVGLIAAEELWQRVAMQNQSVQRTIFRIDWRVNCFQLL